MPGQLLGHPGPPLNNLQVKSLLEELYKLDARKALQTSSKPKHFDITNTDDASHVYIKVDEPKGLSPRWEGPYPIVARPSRSQVQVRVGSYVNGAPRLSTYHWSSCQVAHLRSEESESSRPNLGRRPKPPPAATQLTTDAQGCSPNKASEYFGGKSSSEPTTTNQPVESQPAKIQIVQTPPFSNPAMNLVSDTLIQRRPAISTRNPNPLYVDGLAIAA